MAKLLFHSDNMQLSGLEGPCTWKQRSILSCSPTNLNVTGSSHLPNKGAALELVAGQVVDLFMD